MNEEISYGEYWKEVASLAKQVTKEARELDEDIYDVLHETIDSHQWVIYTAYNFDVLRHSPNDDYSFVNFGRESICDKTGIKWAALAYGALYGDVCDHADFDALEEATA